MPGAEKASFLASVNLVKPLSLAQVAAHGFMEMERILTKRNEKITTIPKIFSRKLVLTIPEFHGEVRFDARNGPALKESPFNERDSIFTVDDLLPGTLHSFSINTVRSDDDLELENPVANLVWSSPWHQCSRTTKTSSTRSIPNELRGNVK